MRRILAIIVCLCVFLLPGAMAQGITTPDAGRLLQEQKQLESQPPKRLPSPEQGEDEGTPVADTGVRVNIKGFRFSGITGVASETELQPLVQQALGKELDLAELQSLAKRVTIYLRSKNYLLARAYLPEQDITEGIVEIAVIAGRIEGQASIQAGESLRLRESFLLAMANRGAAAGTALRDDQLERSLLLMNDLPGISAQAILERGSAPGTTRVLIDITEGPLFSGGLSVDNFGNRYTGTVRGSAQAAINDPFGSGDQFRLALTAADDLRSGVVGYSLPLGSSGLKGSINYFMLTYELEKELSDLDAEGRANTLSVNLSYPHIRTRRFSLWQGISYEHRDLEDEMADDVVRDRELDVATLDLSASTYDRFGGGALNSMRVSVSFGHLNLGIAADAAADAAGPGTEGAYSKFTYSLSRLQRLTNRLNLFGAVNGQLAWQNLDSSEKFLLGGPAAVRAYPVGEAAGDEGHCITVELRYELPVKPRWSDIQIIAFFDAGNITLYNETWDNAVNTATGRNDYWLYGGGGGINLGKTGRYALRVSATHTVGGNPGRSTAGKNADNKTNDSRFWLQGILWF
ncbi:MAG: ShlB/FhaC/HecB family hemolysin secretion/activation protein [Desulfuromonadaceae bacterium]